ncbi:hypothetical protein GCM10023405_44710 [Streptomonospora salina]
MAATVTTCDEYRTCCDMNPALRGKERTGAPGRSHCAAGIGTPGAAAVWEDPRVPHGPGRSPADTPAAAGSGLSWRPGGDSPFGGTRESRAAKPLDGEREERCEGEEEAMNLAISTPCRNRGAQ